MNHFFKIKLLFPRNLGRLAKVLALLNCDLHESFSKNPGKVGNRLERVNLLYQQSFLESLEGFRNVKECPKKVFGNLENFLGKSAKFFKKLNYYPNEISDDP